MSVLTTLRQQLAGLVAPPPSAGTAIPTGFPALDAALSDGGVPCGRLTEILGARGSGKTTLVRVLVAQALADKRWVAYIDAARTLAPADWAPLPAAGRLWVVRPPPPAAGGAEHGAWCADILLRSGAFNVVVLDGGPPLPRGVAVRLTRLARESHAALLVLRDDEEGMRGGGGVVGGAVRIRVTRRRPRPPTPATPAPRPRAADRWHRMGARLARAADGEGGTGSSPGRGAGGQEGGTAPPSPLQTTFTLTLSVEKGGTHHVVEVGCAIDVARRLCTHPEVPDRRAVAPRNRRGERASPDAPGARRTAGAPALPGAAAALPSRGGAGGPTLPPKRRYAEPAVRRDDFLLGAVGGDGAGSPR